MVLAQCNTDLPKLPPGLPPNISDTVENKTTPRPHKKKTHKKTPLASLKEFPSAVMVFNFAGQRVLGHCTACLSLRMPQGMCTHVLFCLIQQKAAREASL